MSGMAKVARKLEFGRKHLSDATAAKRCQARDKCENFETTVEFGIMNLASRH